MTKYANLSINLQPINVEKEQGVVHVGTKFMYESNLSKQDIFKC